MDFLQCQEGTTQKIPNNRKLHRQEKTKSNIPVPKQESTTNLATKGGKSTENTKGKTAPANKTRRNLQFRAGKHARERRRGFDSGAPREEPRLPAVHQHQAIKQKQASKRAP
jgi:hypothetical protein